MNRLGQSSTPIAYLDQWCNNRHPEDRHKGSCSSCALPHQYMSDHEVVMLTRPDKFSHLPWHLSFPNSCHQVGFLPDIPDQPENWPIFVFGLESLFSFFPLDPPSLAFCSSCRQEGDCQGQERLRGEGRTRLNAGPYLENSNAFLSETK